MYASFPSTWDLVTAAPTWQAQLALVLLQAAAWHYLLNFKFPQLLRTRIDSMKNKKHFLDMMNQLLKKMFLIDLDKEAKGAQVLFEFATIFPGVLVQHFVGGLLCLPSVLGLPIPIAASASLACHGALCEAGWEVMDTLHRWWSLAYGGKFGRLFLTPDEVKKFAPLPFQILMLFHHSAGLMLVLPLNIWYRDNVYYHEGVMMLQLAAAVGLGCQLYGFTLDVKEPRDLLMMKILVVVSWVVIVWSRVLRYGFVWYVLLTSFHADGNFLVLRLACFPVVLLSLFNIVMVLDATGKMAKFLHMHADQSCPEEIQQACVRSMSSFRLERHPSTMFPSKGRCHWAKVRGAVGMMLLGKELQQKQQKLVKLERCD